MAKVRFPLEMADEIQVRNLEELKENFNVERVIGYFLDGKLLTWLNDRYYDEEAEKVFELSADDSELGRKLCEIFSAEYKTDEIIDTEEIALKNKRIAKLKQFTDDDEIINNIDFVAFNQEELADLYDKGAEKIYLCEGEFSIPKSKQELEYVEIGYAKVHDIVNKIKIEKNTVQSTKHEEQITIKVILTEDKNLFLIDSQSKKIIANNVKCFCENSEYIFYSSDKENTNMLSCYTINKYCKLTERIETVVSNEYADSIFCNDKYIVWINYRHEIKYCDINIALIEIIANDYYYSSVPLQIYNNFVYYIDHANPYDSFEKKNSKLYSINLETKAVERISCKKDTFYIYNEKVYTCMYIENGFGHAVGSTYMDEGNHFYVSNIDGSNEKEIKMIYLDSHMYGLGGITVNKIYCNNDILYYTYHDPKDAKDYTKSFSLTDSEDK